MSCLEFYSIDEEMVDIKKDVHKCSYSLPTIPKRIDDVLGLLSSMLPQVSTKPQFQYRPVSLGFTADDFSLLKKHCGHPLYTAEQKSLMFRILRRFMLFMLIPCPGCTTVDSLLNILEKEFYSGTPSKAPKWYWSCVDSTSKEGGRIGYLCCENKGCPMTEDSVTTFQRCSRCKGPSYCSKNCQILDWKDHHKNKCDKESMYRRQANGRKVFVDHCLNVGIPINKLNSDCLLFYKGKKKAFNADTVINAIRDDPQGRWKK